MLGEFIQKSIERPIATSVLFAGITIAGLFAAFRLPLEIFPSIDLPRLYVTTHWPGASPYNIESELTSVVEAELASVKGISEIMSYSREGQSQIELRLHRDANVNYTRFAVQERLGFLLDRLPPHVYPPRISKYIPGEFRTSRFLSYHVVGPLDDARLRETAERKLKPVLNGIPGVAGVEVIGGRERQIQIIFHEEQLKKWGIFANDIYRAVRNADFISTIGRIMESDQSYSVMLREHVSSLDDLRSLPVKFIGRRCVVLGDIASVIDGLSPYYSIQRTNGEPTILMNITREPNTNVISVADRVYDAINRLQGRLPEGIKLIKEDDQSRIIRAALRRLVLRAVVSFLVVLLILTLFLRSMRYTLLVQASIVISILFTVLVMFVCRYTLNMITFAGLALGFGFLVDNSIVVLENIFRYREHAQQDSAAYHGTDAVARPIIASTLTTIAALIPFLYLMEELRAYYAPFAVTVSVALIASLVVSFSLIPAFAKRFFAGKSVPGGIGQPAAGTPTFSAFEALRKAYTSVLRACLKRPVPVVVIVIWIFGIPFWKLPRRVEFSGRENATKEWTSRCYNAVMDSGFMSTARPYLDHILGGTLHLFVRYVDRYEFRHWSEQTYIRSHIRLPSGSPIDETDRIVRLIEGTISGTEGIHQVRTNVYPNHAYITVTFEPEYERGAVPFLVREKIIKRALQIGNARISVSGFGPGFVSGSSVSMQNRMILTGYNYTELERCLEGIVDRLETYERVQNIRTDLTRYYYPSGVFENTLELDGERMASWEISSADVIHQVTPYLSHYLYRQRLRVGSEELPFAIHSAEYRDYQLYQLQNLELRNSTGQKVPLHHISLLRRKPIPPVIERSNQQYYRIISFDYLASHEYTRRFIDDFVRSVRLPPGYALAEYGYNAWPADKKRSITIVLCIALLLMYMVLAGLYESFGYPLLVFLIVPLSLIGVFLIYYGTGATFDQSAYIGVILLIGIVLNNAIILLDTINRLRRERQFESFEELLVQAGRERLRPILMTTLTTIGGLLSLILLSSVHPLQSKDLWYTLSLSTAGGLASGSALGLVVLPVIVLLMNRAASKMQRSIINR